MGTMIYKIVEAELWRQAEARGLLAGAPVDLADGYMHFSTAGQLRETARRHFAGKDDLVLVSVDAGRFGEELRWEISRGGERFPHLYAALPLAAVAAAVRLERDAAGSLAFPDHIT